MKKIIVLFIFIFGLSINVFSEGELDTASMSLWVKADNYLEPNAHGLYEWTDFSPEKNNLTAVDEDKAPVYKENAINGYGSLLFDGVDDKLSAHTNAYEGNSTIFIVGKFKDNGVYFSTGEPDGITIDMSHGAASLKSNSDSISYLTADSSYHIYTIKTTITKSGGAWYSASIQVFCDGVKVFNDIVRTNSTLGKWNSHYGYTISGDLEISEAIVYKKGLSTSQLGAVNDYLNSKYFEAVSFDELTLRYKEADGTPSEVVREGGYISITGSITGFPDEAMLITTVFDNGNLFDVNVTPCGENGGFLRLPEELENAEIKCYVWDRLDRLTPLKRPIYKIFDYMN